MGVRAGQGFGAAKPKRMLCPECGKKGVTRGKPVAGNIERHCQYCQASWGQVSWEVASGQKTMAEVTAELLKN